MSRTVTSARRFASASAVVTPIIPAPRTRTRTAQVYRGFTPDAPGLTRNFALGGWNVEILGTRGLFARGDLELSSVPCTYPEASKKGKVWDGTGLAPWADAMTSKILVVALVGAGCVGAAGVGAYMAVRSSVAAPPAAAATPAAAAAPGPQSPGVEASKPLMAEAEPVLVPSAPSPSVPDQRPSVTRTVQSSSPSNPAPSVTVSPSKVPGPSATPDAEPAPESPSTTTESVSAAPATPAFDERTIAAAAVIGIRMDTAVSSETARVEDRVSARVTRDVKIEGRTVIPAGARLDGTVTMVERGGKVRDRARIGVRFDTLLLGDTDKLGIQTETIFRDGEAPSNEASSKIGASAVIGSILGAVIGGKKGAAIGATAGAAGGTAAVMAGDRNAAVIPAGAPLTVRLTAPVSVLVPHEE